MKNIGGLNKQDVLKNSQRQINPCNNGQTWNCNLQPEFTRNILEIVSEDKHLWVSTSISTPKNNESDFTNHCFLSTQNWEKEIPKGRNGK